MARADLGLDPTAKSPWTAPRGRTLEHRMSATRICGVGASSILSGSANLRERLSALGLIRVTDGLYEVPHFMDQSHA
jgi:hypothetical protein